MNTTPSPEEIIFTAALALPPAQRAAHVAGACAGDAALQRRVEALLHAHDSAASLLQGSPGDVARTAFVRPQTDEQPGTMIDRYKLLQKIGEGGCGVVYMAEQEEPVRRRVALKVIKPGMDTKEVVARFEAERQALAMMDHPNIARVFDGGTTTTGRPYFVMELVRGVPITRYCDDNNLSTERRLALFTAVCQAVQHAHQKGIIHRDLKPSNVLVTENDGVPVPKVIDFGIAKATQGRLTDATLFTAFEQFIGTPAYMSPEQAAMTSLDVDTRSDIYSLGVLLYELLTGRTPFEPQELVKAGFDEMRRRIREVEPPRPSARLSTLTEADRTTVAKLRGIAPADLTTALAGDLDWIVMRCLEKDRSRRYETASALALDLQHYRDDQPVAARPPSKAYLLQKLFRRHRLKFIVGAGFAALWVLGTVLSIVMTDRALRSEKAAAADAELASNKLRFFTGKVMDLERNSDPALRAALLGAADRIEADFRSDPRIRAGLHAMAGNLLVRAGDYENAIRHAQLAIDTSNRGNLPNHDDRSLAFSTLAIAYKGLGNPARAAEAYGEIARIQEAQKTDSTITRIQQGLTLIQAGDSAKGMNLVQTARQDIVARRGPTDYLSLHAAVSVARAHRLMGQNKEAEALLREATAEYRDQQYSWFDVSFVSAQFVRVRLCLERDAVEEAHSVLLTLSRDLEAFRHLLTPPQRKEFLELLDALIKRHQESNRPELAAVLEKEKAALTP